MELLDLLGLFALAAIPLVGMPIDSPPDLAVITGVLTDSQHGSRTGPSTAHEMADVTGTISDAQHGARTTAAAHAHANLSGIGASDHHAQLHAAAHQPGGGDAMAVDAAAGTGSLRTLGAGAAQAATGNHAHAGTYLAGAPLVTRHDSVVAASNTQYRSISAAVISSSGEADAQDLFPTAATFRRISVRMRGAQPASGSLVFTLRVNGVSTALTVTVPASAAANTSHTATANVAVAVGDLVDVQLVNNATESSGVIGSVAFDVGP